MKVVHNLLFSLLSFFAVGQAPLFEFLDLRYSSNLPKSLASERSIVIVQVPDQVDGVRRVGDWQALSEKAHKAFITMGIDVVTYLNRYDLVASPNSRKAFAAFFVDRNIQNVLFLRANSDRSCELIIAPFNGKESLINYGATVYRASANQLSSVLLETGKEIRRADFSNENFLIPSKPNFTSGLSIVERTLLQNYPGILRRSKLSVERFATIPVPKNASEETIREITNYNEIIGKKNVELDTLLKQHPYDFEVIDPTSDDDLLRSRRQFVLRSITGQAKTLRQMLDYNVTEGETDFVSIIPIMPDQTKAKPIPKDALVHKFYVRQNISKNIHVGEWDADVTWQQALQNMIGNLIQEHNVDK